MASIGHDVIGIDVDERKVAALDAGSAPFFEPQLTELLAEGRASGRLRFSSRMADAAGAQVHFLAVGHPADPRRSRGRPPLRRCGDRRTAPPSPRRRRDRGEIDRAGGHRRTARCARHRLGRDRGVEPRVPSRGVGRARHADTGPARGRRRDGLRGHTRRGGAAPGLRGGRRGRDALPGHRPRHGGNW